MAIGCATTRHSPPRFEGHAAGLLRRGRGAVSNSAYESGRDQEYASRLAREVEEFCKKRGPQKAPVKPKGKGKARR